MRLAPAIIVGGASAAAALAVLGSAGSAVPGGEIDAEPLVEDTPTKLRREGASDDPRDGGGTGGGGDDCDDGRSSGDGDGPGHVLDRRLGVYDGVFPPSALSALGDLSASHFRRRSREGSYFVRPSPPSALSPLERAVDSILEAFNDASPYVEIWTRGVYINMDAHCDIDDPLLEETGRLRHADMAHVLYLSVGEDVVAPTFVFPDRRVGWDAVDVGPNAERNDPSEVEMVVVPAVPGRLLRFDGRAMHAVPRPADRYLLSFDDEIELKEEVLADDDDHWEGWEEPDDEDDGEVEDAHVHWYDWEGRGLAPEEDRRERFVLLFNTWSGSPPLGVDLDGKDERGGGLGAGEPERGRSGDGRDGARARADAEPQAKWRGAFGPRLERLTCAPPSEWVPADVVPPPPPVGALSPPAGAPDDVVPLRIKLMGSRARRVRGGRHATVHVDRPAGEEVARAVRERRAVSRFVLRQRREATAGGGGAEAAPDEAGGGASDASRR